MTDVRAASMTWLGASRSHAAVAGIFAALLSPCPIAYAQDMATPVSADDVRRLLPSYGALIPTEAGDAYKAAVFDKLGRANDIGRTAMGVPHVTGVHFVIGSAGDVAGAMVTRKSGSPEFDSRALAMIRKAAPFPSPPEGAPRAFDADIRFNRGAPP